jgi:hypothetical protein
MYGWKMDLEARANVEFSAAFLLQHNQLSLFDLHIGYTIT